MGNNRLKNGLPACLVMAVVSFQPAKADSISFQLQNLVQTAVSGGVAIFEGTVTNQSGTDLNASDFFFNFSGFDFASVNPVQDLGEADFKVVNGTTSGVVDLFEVVVGTVPLGSDFPIDVQLQDALSDLSEVQTVTVSIPGPSTSPVPEPQVLPVMLILIALLSYGVHGAKPVSRKVRRLFALFVPALLVAAMAPFARAQSGAPLFTTKSPVSGVINQTFHVMLPIVNSGTGAANNVTVTSATLGAATPKSPALPLLLNTLNPGDHSVINLQFDGGKLTLGSNYLLNVRGTYKLGTKVLGFSVNRFLQAANPSADAKTVLQRWIALDAVTDFSNSLPGVDPVADGQAMLNFLKTRPEFVASGMDPDGSSVWARFADGRIIIVCDDRPLTTPPPTPASTSAPAVQVQRLAPRQASALHPELSGGLPPSDLPFSSSVRLLNALTGPGWVDHDVILDLSNMLVPQNYKLASAGASVDDLKGVGGDGVFYFTTHGGFSGDGTKDSPRLYALWTTTEADVLNDDELAPDFLLNRVVYLLAVESYNPKFLSIHEGITAEFVTRYWKDFSQASFVYIDSCRSDVDPTFKQAILNKKASVYAGWSDEVPDDFAGNTARLVFDRLLGANAFFQEQGLPQRPFDWTQVQIDLPLHNLGQLPSGGQLNFTASASGVVFGELAPTIASMLTDEAARTLRIGGSFGQEPGGVDGHITVGDTRVTLIQPWDPNVLIVDLSDPNLAGDVTVEVRSHKSNVARLTMWEGSFIYNEHEADSLAQNFTMQVAFRTDIRQFRISIHDKPFEPAGPVTEIAALSSATFACSGTHVYSGSPGSTTTVTWTGKGSVKAIPFPPLSPPTGGGFDVSGGLLGSHTQLGLFFALEQQPSPPCNENNHIVDTKPPGVFDISENLDICFASKKVTLALNDDAVIQGSGAPLSASGGCGGFGGSGTFRWESITPINGTAPDPLSAR